MRYYVNVDKDNEKWKCYLRSKSKDLNGRTYVIVGWKNGRRPGQFWWEDFLECMTEITEEEYEATIPS